LKIKRARMHISELDGILASFLQRRPYKVVIEDDADPKFSVIRCEFLENIPELTPAVFGDAVHNLRSALDHVACDLVARNGKTVKRVSFPIVQPRENMDAKIKEAKFMFASDSNIGAVKSVIYDNWGLAKLHELDIHDKHRSVLLTGLVSTGQGCSVTSHGGTLTLIPRAGDSVIDGTRQLISRVALTDHDVYLPCDIALTEEFGLNGVGISNWLGQISSYVERLVDAFERFNSDGGEFDAPNPVKKTIRLGPILVA